MKKCILILCLFLITTFIYFSCVHHLKEIPNPSVSTPAGLTYNPSVVQIATGQSFSSATPTLSSGQAIVFSIVTDIDNQGSISINSKGVIQIDSNLAPGTYVVTVTAGNETGSATFKNAYHITVTGTSKAPSTLTYSSDTLTLNNGTAGISAPPSVVGTHPIVFKLSSIPSSGGHISINDSTGAISVDSALVPGNYSVSVTATNPAGTKTFTNVIVISIQATKISSLTYMPNTLELLHGAAGASPLPVLAGTIPVTYSISTNPASGGQITINSATGQITAGAGLAIGTYIITVTATNPAGSASFANVFDIKVSANIAAPGSLSYATSTLALNSGQTGSSVAPTVSGTTPITYSLPAGTNPNIHIDPQTGIISTTSALPDGTYALSVTATNAAGSTSSAFIITVKPVDAPSNLSYIPSSIIVTQGSAGSSPVPTITSSQAVTYGMTSSPASTAISIDTKTGVIVSSSTLPLGTYYIQVIAANSGGTITFINAFSITVTSSAPANLVYSPNVLSLAVGTVGSSTSPTINGTGPFTYSFSTAPASAGITINSSTGVITSGASTPVGNYLLSVTATNTAGSLSFSNVYTVNITSSATKPGSLMYTPASLSLNQGQIGSSVAPTVTGTTPITYSITTAPASSGNVTINLQTGVITTSSNLATGSYVVTVTATNSLGSTTATYTITVNATALPSGLSYSVPSYTVSQGTTGSSVTPTITGGPVTYSLTTSPATSAVTINSTTGVISSTSALPVGTYNISVTATNAGGSKLFTNIYTITVTAVAPTALVYAPASYTVTQGTAGSSVAPTVSGTPPITYSLAVVPASANISINTTTGVISSTGTVTPGTYSITVTASNSAGTTTATYSITVNTATVAPSALVYTPNALTVAQGVAGSSVVPTVSGTAPLTYALVASPANAGITVNSTSGVIAVAAGTAAGTYAITVTATNAAGSVTAAYSVTVTGTTVIALTGLTYTPNTLTADHGVAKSSATPTITGTGPVTYSITVAPAAAGITVNSSTGVITVGTTVALGTYTVTVTASSTAGTGSTTTATYTVTVAPSYVLDIKPIMSGSCTNCHGNGGTAPNLSTITGVSNNINNILIDVQATSSTSANHVMPPSGGKLSTAQINLLKQWMATGMLP